MYYVVRAHGAGDMRRDNASAAAEPAATGRGRRGLLLQRQRGRLVPTETRCTRARSAQGSQAIQDAQACALHI